MLSKAKGQILRVAACMHILFLDFDERHEDIPTFFKDIPEEISEKAIIAAQNFVEVCCQHMAFLAGRRKIDNEITRHSEGICIILI